MQARVRKNTAVPGGFTLIDRLDQAITWLTLAALFLVPLTFSFFHFTALFTEPRLITLHLLSGLILTLWAWRITLELIRSDSYDRILKSWDLISWTGRNPARWAIVAIAVLVVVQLASTLLSPLPVISFYGGDEARTGYNLYDSLSMLVIFFSIALRFRTRRELKLIIYTLIGSGTIAAAYGLAQHFGWDPIGDNQGNIRPLASFGNTLNFAAYLVMTIPATLALIYRQVSSPNRWWPPVLTIALGLQLAAIWMSGGRGPYVGAFTGLIVFFAIVLVLFELRAVAKSFAILIVGSVIAGIIIVLPSPKADIGFERLISIGDQLQGGASTTSTEIKGGLAGRFQIWGSSLKIATTWPTPVEEPVVSRILRPVFGLGPDMLVYSYPLVGKPQIKLASVDNAHNYPLQILVEQGFAGFIALIGASLLLVISAFKTVRFLKGRNSDIQIWHLPVLALLPAAAGKLAELQTGVPRISDMTMTFAIFAGVLVVHELVAVGNSDSVSNTPIRKVNAPRELLVGSGLLASIAITVVFLLLFIGWDMRRLSASLLLVDTHDDPRNEVKAEGWADAQAIAPERETMTHSLADAYLKEAIKAEREGETELAIKLAEAGRDLLLEYEQRDPFEWDVQMLLAQIVSRLVTWGETQYAQEMADRYRRTVELYPSYPSIVGTAATAVTSVGLHELAIEFADLAISMEATTQPWSKAWYAKGRALFELDRVDEAIIALQTATEKQPSAEGALLAHRTLARIYQLRGEEELMEYHNNLGSVEPTFEE